MPRLEVPEQFSPLVIDSDDVLVSAVKRAERDPEGGPDRSGDMIVRLYSVAVGQSRCNVRFGFPVAAAWISNMAEDRVSALTVDGESGCSVSLSPFEIVTLRIKAAL